MLRADGGATANRFLMQFQADLIGTPVEVAEEAETTALGAAALAGLGIQAWRSPADIAGLVRRGATFEPSMARDTADAHREDWRRALNRARPDGNLTQRVAEERGPVPSILVGEVPGAHRAGLEPDHDVVGHASGRVSLARRRAEVADGDLTRGLPRTLVQQGRLRAQLDSAIGRRMLVDEDGGPRVPSAGASP